MSSTSTAAAAFLLEQQRSVVRFAETIRVVEFERVAPQDRHRVWYTKQEEEDIIQAVVMATMEGSTRPDGRCSVSQRWRTIALRGLLFTVLVVAVGLDVRRKIAEIMHKDYDV